MTYKWCVVVKHTFTTNDHVIFGKSSEGVKNVN